LKHDGFRALAHIWDGNCELVSRRRNTYKSFQELKDNLAKLKVKDAIIDGELVCLDEEGRSIFNLVRNFLCIGFIPESNFHLKYRKHPVKFAAVRFNTSFAISTSSYARYSSGVVITELPFD
jgi:hypothetical protein